MLVATLVFLEVLMRLTLGNLAGSKLREIGPHGACVLKPGAEVDYTGWLIRIPAVRESVNELGYRGAPYPLEKPPGTFRVLFLGDSFAFGQGVPGDATIPAQLEKTLAASLTQPVQVLNFGIEGLNLEEVRERYVHVASRWEHDLALYLLSPNDLDNRGCKSEDAWFFTVLQECYVARLPLVAFAIFYSLVTSIGNEGPDVAEERAALAEGLRALEAAIAEEGAALAVVSLGSPLEGQTDWSELGPWPVLDVSAVLQEGENKIRFEGHLNERGGGLVADAIDGWLRTDPAWRRLGLR